MPSFVAPNTRWVGGCGCGCTTPLPPSNKDCEKAPTKPLKRKSPSIGQDPSRSLLMVPLQRPTPLTDAHSETNCCILTSFRTCPILLPNPASLWHVENPAPTRTMLRICPNISSPASRNTSYTPSRLCRPHTTLQPTTSPPLRF